jgi:plasmid stabilization system protein ParE
MKPKRVTQTAKHLIQHITGYIYERHPGAAERYYAAVMQGFEGFDERFLPRRASDDLPDYIREASVPGFKGYTIRIAILDDAIYLIAAFAPRQGDERKAHSTQSGLREID